MTIPDGCFFAGLTTKDSKVTKDFKTNLLRLILKLLSFVTFVPFKVNCVAREGALGHVVNDAG